MSFKTIEFIEGKVRLIDQTRLPQHKEYIDYDNYKSLIVGIKDMIVRGAPAIGVTGAYAAVFAIKGLSSDKDAFINEFDKRCIEIIDARPTAVNLEWGVKRIQYLAHESLKEGKSFEELSTILYKEAADILEEDIALCKKIGQGALSFIPDKCTILTHCNAGALATAGYGTALGVIRAAVEAGKEVKVFADETRPYNQGSRLTTWELMEDNIDVTLITDNMAGHFMKKGMIDLVVVGADRIAANGDAANKIGTYSVAVLAKENNIPFYVAAPYSTIDKNIKDGEGIPIEERPIVEITHSCGQRVTPEGVKVLNPAFDATPNKYIRAIFTEKGAIEAPYIENLWR
ncbi:MAG: S-methyl-5-thioribose-1-phosphate isomerase [Nitrospinae bacterium]|nr:S-methyl-5-thioribose-1-phosphate isomerase [Nitrospinota bacterium]